MSASFEAAWTNVLLPWFETTAPGAFEVRLPVAVVTPFRSHAYLLRSRFLARGTSLLGVKFLSPAQLRDQLSECGRVFALPGHACGLLRLDQVERAEAYLRDLGVTGDLRVRHHGERARIEVEPQWIPWLEQRLAAVTRQLGALGFGVVEVDPRGYRRGSLVQALRPRV